MRSKLINFISLVIRMAMPCCARTYYDCHCGSCERESHAETYSWASSSPEYGAQQRCFERTGSVENIKQNLAILVDAGVTRSLFSDAAASVGRQTATANESTGSCKVKCDKDRNHTRRISEDKVRLPLLSVIANTIACRIVRSIMKS